ncbi:MAG: DUF2490 domain-containing protein [Bacteroidetes bacterium]|nr:MAG: DUF2490 domain-containing protein [Bacteroidota bacterium]
MKTNMTILTILVGIFCAFDSTAQPFLNWNRVNVQKQLSNKQSVFLEGDLRLFASDFDVQQFMFRAGWLTKLDNHNESDLGLAYFHSLRNSDNTKASHAEEYRLHQSFRYLYPSKFPFFARFRVEERFLPTEWTIRPRYMLGVEFPLGSGRFILSEEYLHQYHSGISRWKFDQNRVELAYKHMLSRDDKQSMYLGFMWMSQNQRDLRRYIFRLGYNLVL